MVTMLLMDIVMWVGMAYLEVIDVSLRLRLLANFFAHGADAHLHHGALRLKF